MAGQVSFLLLVAGLAVGFVWAVGPGSRARSEDSATVLRWSGIAAAIVATWLAVSGVVAAAGWLSDFSRLPAPFLVFLVLVTLATTALAFSPVGTRLAGGLGLAGLVGFQVFRFPLELWLHQMWRAGLVPPQMTFAGWNFDLLSGLAAGGTGLWIALGKPPGWVVPAWNVAGLALLLTIVSIAVLSAPTPWRAFSSEPANTFVATFPYVWLPCFLVQAAWFGHLLVFRRIAGSQDRTGSG